MHAPAASQTSAASYSRTALWLGLLLAAVCLYRIGYVASHDYNLYVDEAQYWLWSKTPAWGYFSKPPLTAWLIAASTGLFGDGELAVKLPALLLYPLAAGAIGWTAWRIAGARAALVAAALFLSMPGQAAEGWVISPDAPLLLCWALALGLLHAAMQPGAKTWQWLLLGGVVGIGLLGKYTMAVFVLTAAWVLWRQRGARAVAGAKWGIGPWLALAVALLVLAPNAWWNAQHDFGTVRHTARLAQTELAGVHFDHLGNFLGAQWLIVGVIAFPLLLARLWRGDAPAVQFLRPFIVPYLLAMCALALYSDANANWAVTSYVGASVLLGAWLAHPQRQRLLAATLAVNVLLGVLAMHYRDVATWSGIRLSTRANLYSRVLSWRELGEAVQPYADANPGLPVISHDRTVLAEMGYYLKPRPYPVAALDYDGQVSNQYELSTLEAGLPARALWVVETRDSDWLRPRFASATLLGIVKVQAPQGPLRTMQVWRVVGPRALPGH